MRKNKSAVKKAQVAVRNQERNRQYKSAVRTAIKKVRVSLEQKADVATVQANMSAVHSLLDKAVFKGIYHKNTVARYKSRLMQRIHKYSVSLQG
ncbi:MAG: 30S ribosomal protein S20 [Vampirovibrionales bacterium]